jgi:hypothetical protein
MTELQRGFLTPLRVENIDACNWRIFDRFGWRGSQDDEFWVEPGETTDFATVPWWSQIITPRTGTWTKAAVLHDKMCNLLNEFYDLMMDRERLINEGVDPESLEECYPPRFSSIDTDAIFRKNAREGGTGFVRSELLWVGVRSGALANPARREGWLKTAPRYVLDVMVILAVLVAVIAFISWAWPW